MKTILITVLVSVVAAIIVSPVSGNSAAQASWSYELNNTSGETLKVMVPTVAVTDNMPAMQYAENGWVYISHEFLAFAKLDDLKAYCKLNYVSDYVAGLKLIEQVSNTKLQGPDDLKKLEHERGPKGVVMLHMNQTVYAAWTDDNGNYIAGNGDQRYIRVRFPGEVQEYYTLPFAVTYGHNVLLNWGYPEQTWTISGLPETR